MKKVDAHMNFPALEKGILEYWKANNIFEKSLKKDAPNGKFVFYEGPPTANGKPGLHHVLARSFKDVIPRYKTMQGYTVERKAGWDTHGLPVELQVEKALGLRSKQDIENIIPGDVRASIIEFNKKCKESVWEYKDLWEKMTERMGYWVDMEHPYVTYGSSYIESVWWQLKQIAEGGYLYQGHKVVPYCYRCGTALSSHEVAQGYQTVKDNSVYVKFKVKAGQKIGEFETDEKTYFLVWTTTPWTLPGNVALAINPEEQYFRGTVETSEVSDIEAGETYIFVSGSERNIFGNNLSPVSPHENDYTWAGVNFSGKGNLIFEKIEILPGFEYLGKVYESFYDTSDQSSYEVVRGDFVNTDSGTGIVHIAPAFGEDDMRVAQEHSLPVLVTVNTEGKMNADVPGDGILVKKKNDKNRYAVDDLIIEDLKNRGLLFKEEVYEHEYPFCWRCDTPLIYYAKPSWFIRISDLREELLEGNEEIQWIPENLKEGRFGEWLKGAKDWAISRERYWGTPLPIWNCDSCDQQTVVGSQKELKELSGATLEDLHKPYIDDISWNCSCGGKMTRTPEVLDVWFDSGAMPLAQNGYIGEGEVPSFPADYISEAIDQTRGWFYTLHAIATLLSKRGVVEEKRAYRHVICLGHVLDEKGKKMSKSKGNVIDPFEMFDTYGADSLRWFFFSLNNPGLPKKFDPKSMREVQGRVFRMLWNSYSFFTIYATLDNFKPQSNAVSSVKIDRWILSELRTLIKEVERWLDNYEIFPAVYAIEGFIDKLSNWYIRRSRKRFWKNENDADKNDAYQTLYTVLVELSKLMAPFAPFLAEEIHKNLTGKESVHLENWTKGVRIEGDIDLMRQMGLVRVVVSEGLQQRSALKIKVRQPLKRATILFELDSEFQEIIQDELNIKEVVIDINQQEPIILDFEITAELKLEGEAREIIRAIQEGRKKAGLNIEDRIILGYQGMEEVFQVHGEEIAKEVLAEGGIENDALADGYTETVVIDTKEFSFSIKRK